MLTSPIAPNGLVPQAPEHTAALSIREQLDKENGGDGAQEVRTTRVVEQRVSHVVIGVGSTLMTIPAS